MFTGIIRSQAVLRDKKKLKNQIRLIFDGVSKRTSFQLGESVAIDGTCLTVSQANRKSFSFDVIPETFQTTTLGGLKIGQRVNLERSLRVGDELGGHWVSGHIDGIGRIKKIERRGENFRLHIETTADIINSSVLKGSIAIDGISLTLQEIQARSFVIGVTPFTYKATTLQWKRVGDPVNLEIDLFAKLVQHFLSKKKTSGLKEKDLRRQGF